MPVLPHVLSQHAEEAAFLWILRDQAVGAPHYSLKDLADLDDRVDAHIDGLRVAGDDGWEALRSELSWNEPGEIFAAAQMAFEQESNERIEEVLAVVGDDVELARGVISALGWMPYDQAQRHIETLLGSKEPFRRRLGIGASAVHRRDPGIALAAEQTGSDALSRSRALRAVGELGRADLAGRCVPAFESEDDATRLWAAWSAARFGDPKAVQLLLRIAKENGPHALDAAGLALRRMEPPEARRWCHRLGNRRLGLIGLGIVGDPTDVGVLLEAMEDDELARPAGEALTSITGLDIAYDDLDRDEPEGFDAGPTEDSLDENVSMDPDEDLPWPDAGALRAWWSERRGEFREGVRHLLGKPIEERNLGKVLREGRQRQRAAAALELGLVQPAAPLFEVRAPGFRQQTALS